MTRKLLAVFAHPDDEAFGPGGTIARYADEGVEIHLLCATRGEAGKLSEEVRIKNLRSGIKRDIKLGSIREKELLKSAKILGVKKVEFLGFIDGTLCNALYQQIAKKIMKKITSFKPQVILTQERLGVSGHLDHIAISMTTTYSYLKTKIARKLYYHCLTRDWRKKEKSLDNYFIYFPEGYKSRDITTRIDFSSYWDKKVAAMMVHQSQQHDVKRILNYWTYRPKVDHFILQFQHNLEAKFPERDLFAGISG